MGCVEHQWAKLGLDKKLVKAIQYDSCYVFTYHAESIGEIESPVDTALIKT